MVAFDKGPPAVVARHLARLPEVPPEARELFWYDWGPVFYRGRLSGNPRVLGIASDPGPTERIVGRTLVGDAGQRVQGFLAKAGLTRSYVLVNAFPWALHPSRSGDALPLLELPEHLAWRNRLLDLVTGPSLQAIVAFGRNAQRALELWTRAPDVPVFNVPHPSSRDEAKLTTSWAAAVEGLRALVTTDPDGHTDDPNYGTEVVETDYRPIPDADLPYGLPPWVGDDAWGRRAAPAHRNCVRRSDESPEHELIWQAPTPAELG